MPSDFITIEYLTSFSGMVVALGLIVQFTKSIVKRMFSDQAVRFYAFIWAILLVLAMYWSKGMFDVEGKDIFITFMLVLINAIMVTLAAMGGYEVITDPRATKRKLSKPIFLKHKNIV